MRTLANQLSRFITAAGLAVLLLLPQIGYSQTVEEEPSALAMMGDLVVARPLLLVVTVLGTAGYLISLPFSLAGGNAKEAGETLVVGPARATFVRCLGCTRPGYKQKVINLEE